MNTFSEFLVISRVEYDCLKKAAAAPGRPLTSNSVPRDARTALSGSFPSKYQHVVGQLITHFEAAPKIFSISANYYTLKIIPGDVTYNLQNTIRILLYEHEQFLEEDYQQFKKAFNSARISEKLILNTVFAAFIKKPLQNLKRKSTVPKKSSWLNYEKFKTRKEDN